MHNILTHLATAHSLTASAHNYSNSGPGLGAILAVLAVICIIFIAIAILILVSQWRIYKKAGRPGWASIVPFYNIVVWLEMVGEPLWWALLFFVPIVNLVLWVIITNRLAKSFGKGKWFTVGMLFLPFIFYPILAFGKATYTQIFEPTYGISELVKWALIAGVTFCFLEGMVFASGFSSGANSQYHELTIVSGDDGYATDGVYVYSNDTLVEGADPESFVDLGGGYAADNTNGYYEGDLIKGAGGSNLKIVLPSNSDQYSTNFVEDGQKVYYGTDAITGADPATFVDINSGYAKDATHIYNYGSVVTGADLSTFVVEDSPDSSKIYYDAKDKNNYYESGVVVSAK
jgi:hypothetical protein